MFVSGKLSVFVGSSSEGHAKSGTGQGAGKRSE
jgi:hypothetical protein